MRFTTILTLTVAFCFCVLTGCSIVEDTPNALPDTAAITTEPDTDKPEIETGENTQIPNPWTDCTSLDELNAAAGTDLHAPAGLDVTDENFSYMSDDAYTLAEYVFTYNGGTYTLRTAPTQEDISGVYQDGQTLTELAGADDNVITTNENALWSHWFDGDTQLSLYATSATAEDYTAVRTALQGAE